MVEVYTRQAEHLRRAGRPGEAAAAARTARRLGSETIGGDNWRTALATAQLAYALIESGKDADAAPLIAEANAMLEPIIPPDHPWRAELAGVERALTLPIAEVATGLRQPLSSRSRAPASRSFAGGLGHARVEPARPVEPSAWNPRETEA